MLDKFELWSKRRFRSWNPDAAGALLIGFPFSPLVYASRRLAPQGIPYVIDVGDPWALTGEGGRSHNRALSSLRARTAERRMWADASAAVVTTEGQASALRGLFPSLQTLVRPNGFDPEPSASPQSTQVASRDSRRLRLAHFGNLYAPRVSLTPFLTHLRRSGRWEDVELHQYGSDWTGSLRTLEDVTVEFHAPRPWPEIIEVAASYDLAVVYLQLPIPRLALVHDDRGDALSDYVQDKPGWIVLRADTADAAAPIDRHVSRTWTRSELAPPATESWDHVADEIARFVLRSLDMAESEAGLIAGADPNGP
jgi:hypothetical protein